MKNLFTFKGRAGRLEYFLHSISEIFLLIVFAIALASVDHQTKTSEILDTINLCLFITAFLIGMIAEICVTVRRFHDMGMSGSHFFGTWIPIYNIYLACILLFKSGQPIPNDYGPQRN